MAQKLDILSFKCFNQFRNGLDFSQNLAEFTNNLVGNVNEKVKVEVEYRAGWFAFTSFGEEWELVNNGSTWDVISNNTDWESEGFSVGDVVYFTDDWNDYVDVNSSNATWSGIVTQINSLRMRLGTITGTPTAGTFDNYGCQAWVGVNTYSSLRLNFGLIENQENVNFVNKTTETIQGYYGNALVASSQNLTPIGIKKDFISGVAKSETSVSNFDIATMKFSHELVVTPTLLAGINLLNTNVPSYFENSFCFKYVFDIELKPSISSPRNIKATYAGEQGFTGWFNENFNGLVSNYSSSISYTDTTSLKAKEATDFSITISTTGAGFSNGDVIILYLSRQPQTSDQYIYDEATDKSTIGTWVENFNYEAIRVVLGGGIVNNGNFSNVEATLNTGTIEITGTYTPPLSLAQKIQKGDFYLFATSVQLQGETVGNSTRVMLTTDYQQYNINPFETGIVSFDSFEYKGIKEVYDDESGLLTINAWNEDSILLQGVLRLDKSNDALIDNFNFTLASDNGNNFFELDNLFQDVSNSIIASGIQQIQVDNTRGYLLPAGSSFNFVKIDFDSIDGTDHLYNVQIGFKIKWQEWLKNNTVDTIFFNSSEPQNNLNFKSSNYALGANGYNIKLICTVNTTIGTELGQDVIKGGVINTYDYGVSDNGVISQGLIQLFEPTTMTQLVKPLSNGLTLFRIDWTTTASLDAVNYIAIHRVENSDNPTDSIEEINTEVEDTNNILKPKVGKTLLTREFIPPNTLRTECLIDGLKFNGKVNISGRCEFRNPLPLLWFSLRKVRSDYTGFAVLVRRESDNATKNIGFDANGDFDITAYNTFVGSSVGRVIRWYNQVLVGIDAIQNTLTNQPRIIINGIGGVPSVWCDDTSKALVIPFDSRYDFTTYSVICVWRPITLNASNFNIVLRKADPANTADRQISVGYRDTLVEDRLFFTAFTQNIGQVILGNTNPQSLPFTNLQTAIHDGTNASLYSNKVLQDTQLADIFNVQTEMFIGNGDQLNSSINGYMSEIILYSQPLATFQRNEIEQELNVYYNLGL